MTSLQSEKPSVALAILTNRWPDELNILLDAAKRQTIATKAFLVDASGRTNIPSRDGLEVVPSKLNLGGAGGFSYAILSALASGAEWIWIMDDDAYPVGDDCLEKLLEAAQNYQLDVISPLIIAPENYNRLSFPFKVKGRISYDRADVESLGFIPSVAQFFNGALVRRSVFFKIGMPDIRLFIRGDEVDFMLRLRQAKIPFGTVTQAAVCHPAGWPEVVNIISNRLAVLIPETEFKKYYFFRNRGYLARQHRRFISFCADMLLYPYVYLVKRRCDIKGLSSWWCAYRDGLLRKFDCAPHLSGSLKPSGERQNERS
ncbi:glycosyltransferase [Pseudochrobactrum sp. HB0163]|uniref:glycosyltransferase n=1 Tax=Pseudochrobactrum sp. HB0163 TaxID=3450708 RepID=UPI003F6DD9BB